MRFEFATAGRIVFGPGAIQELGRAAAALGKRALVVTGRNAERAALINGILAKAGVDIVRFRVAGEPTTVLVAEGAAKAREAGCEAVIAFGGGSVLDAGKAIAALATNTRDVYDYLEVIGKGQPLENDPLPCIAVSTTAGTGAEVTRNSVLGSPEHKVKVSMRHPLMLPRVAIVDPELTLSAPPEVTAATGLDALTQLLEVFVSNQANPMTDGFCREGMRRAARSLRKAYEKGDDLNAREDMCIASLFGGITLANARLGAVHGFAGVLGGKYGAPHGAICARLLPLVMETNIRALERSGSGDVYLERYREAARILTGDPSAGAKDGASWVRDLVADLEIPALGRYGVKEADFGEIVAGAQAASSMKGNPVVLLGEDLKGILEAAVG